MGAWGTGVFDNDTACDWAYGLNDLSDLSLIESALDKVLGVGAGYLDAADAEEALAAAESVARLIADVEIRSDMRNKIARLTICVTEKRKQK